MFLAVKNYLEGTDGIRRTIATVVRDMTCIFYQNIKKRETNEPNKETITASYQQSRTQAEK